MIFSIRDLGFELGPFLLEGWLALAARCVCALAIFLAGSLVSLLLRKKICPALRGRTWHFAATPILLRSLEGPLERMAVFTGFYLALASLPWAIASLPKFLLIVYKVLMTLLFCSLLIPTYQVLVVVLGVATAAQIAGFPIGSIVAGAGLVGLTISLAAQESASNLFSGIVILLDKPFAVGDWITVGDVEGEVIDINFRSTRIRSQDKTVSIVTNSKICSSTVQNAALRTMRPYKFTLGVTYNTTRPQLEQLMADLKKMLDESPYTEKGANIVRLTSFGDSSINILVSAYLKTNAYAVFLEEQNDLNLNIMDIMQKNKVDFAFPSTSVYIERSGS